MIEMRLYIVRDCDYKFVAVFADKEDCTDFMKKFFYEKELDYVELVI